MKLKFGNVVIDTLANREEHAKAIESHGNLHCSPDEPYYFFTYDLPNGDDRFVHIHYNNEGTQLIKIRSWDHVSRTWVEMKVKAEQCYFTKNDETKWKTTRVLDNKPWSVNNYIWWINGEFKMNEHYPPKIIVDMSDVALPKDVPEKIIQKKKKLGIF